ncbi:MAG: RloB family protein [Candidatus Zophobacter franzmannii]|nr:RloB family protein [Candidatus Zophobacter franzmannii]
MAISRIREIKPFTHPRTRSIKKIIISTEGSKTEPAYFKALSTIVKENIAFIYLERTVIGHSAPKYIVGLIDEYVAREKKQHGSAKDYKRYKDEYWVVIDQDSWMDLPEIAEECKHKGYNLSISNPCFELWILMHFIPEQELKKLPHLSGCHYAISELRKYVRGYTKARYNFAKVLSKTKYAVQMAEIMDRDKDNPLPECGVTKVHNLIKRLI